MTDDQTFSSIILKAKISNTQPIYLKSPEKYYANFSKASNSVVVRKPIQFYVNSFESFTLNVHLSNIHFHTRFSSREGRWAATLGLEIPDGFQQSLMVCWLHTKTVALFLTISDPGCQPVRAQASHNVL